MRLLRDIHVCGWISQAFIFAAGRQQRPRGGTKLSQPAKTVDSKDLWDEAKVIVLLISSAGACEHRQEVRNFRGCR